ncbi:MAG: hypothetical protein QXY90_04685 [Candidatus Anstonellales archaeon]
MKEGDKFYKLYGIAATVVTATALALPWDQNSCDNVRWWKENGRGIGFSNPIKFIYGGYLEIYRDPAALLGFAFRWNPGELLGTQTIPAGDITTCYWVGVGTVVTHYEGRQWDVPGKVSSMRYVNNFLVVSYKEEESGPSAVGDNNPENKEKVIVFRDTDVVILDSATSVYAVKEVTSEYIVYNVFTENSYEQRRRSNDGTEKILLRTYLREGGL